MSPAGRAAVLAAALGAALLGVRDGIRVPGREARPTPWSALLAPLSAAPMPANCRAAILAAALPGQENHLEPLFEAVARRPDVEWSMPDGWSGAGGFDFIVVAGGTPGPTGWRPVWRSGQVTLLTRER